MPKPQTTGLSQSLTGAGLIAAMLVVDSTFFIFARLLQQYMPPTQSSFYMMTLGSLFVVLYAAWKKRLRFSFLKENLGFFMLIGFLIAVATNLNYEAMAFIDSGTASILSQSTIIFGLVWGLVWLREKLTRAEIIGAVIAVAGVMVITFQKGDYFRLGSLLVLVSSLCYSFHSAVVKKHAGRFDFLEFYAFRLICNCFFLFLWTLLDPAPLTLPPARVWPLLIFAAGVEVCLSRPLYYLVLRRYPISILSILLTISPILTVLWAFLLFDTVPTWLQMLGGAGVISGVMVMAGFPDRLKRATAKASTAQDSAAQGAAASGVSAPEDQSGV